MHIMVTYLIAAGQLTDYVEVIFTFNLDTENLVTKW